MDWEIWYIEVIAFNFSVLVKTIMLKYTNNLHLLIPLKLVWYHSEKHSIALIDWLGLLLEIKRGCSRENLDFLQVLHLLLSSLWSIKPSSKLKKKKLFMNIFRTTTFIINDNYILIVYDISCKSSSSLWSIQPSP